MRQVSRNQRRATGHSIVGIHGGWLSNREGTAASTVSAADQLSPSRAQDVPCFILGEGSKINKPRRTEKLEVTSMRRRFDANAPVRPLTVHSWPPAWQGCRPEVRQPSHRLSSRPDSRLAVERETQIGHIPIGVVRVQVHCPPRQLLTLRGFAKIDRERRVWPASVETIVSDISSCTSNRLAVERSYRSDQTFKPDRASTRRADRRMVSPLRRTFPCTT